jgi:hypothetical protein
MKYKTEYKIILKRNPGGGETFRTNADRPRGIIPIPGIIRIVSLSRGLSGRGVALTTHPI